MDKAIADGFRRWSNAIWEYHCPEEIGNGRRCHLVTEEFTEHTLICPEHGMVDKDMAIPWARCA